MDASRAGAVVSGWRRGGRRVVEDAWRWHSLGVDGVAASCGEKAFADGMDGHWFVVCTHVCFSIDFARSLACSHRPTFRREMRVVSCRVVMKRVGSDRIDRQADSCQRTFSQIMMRGLGGEEYRTAVWFCLDSEVLSTEHMAERGG